jgi:hypothetical protein
MLSHPFSRSERSLITAQNRSAGFQARREALEQKLEEITDTYTRYRFEAPDQ